MNKFFGILTIFLVISIDQFSKYLAKIYGLNIIFNDGISLNLLNGIPNNLMIFFLVLFVFLVFLFLKKDTFKNNLYVFLFLGGAISNILDRIFYAGVRDWLKIPFLDLYNNLADWFIFSGVLIFLLYNTHKKMYKNPIG
ncbi:signal peptidase II [Candidatus Woesebacteria bacterium]|nr:signal peptidase II [Candidatus Woesebacteria bacterium]